MKAVLLAGGGFAVPAYDAALAAGACLLIWLTVRAAVARGLPQRQVALVLAAAYAAGLLGARALFAWERSHGVLELASTLFHPSSGGLSSVGGLVLGATAAAVLGARRGVPFLALADAAAVGLCLAAATGRVGCLLAGCCHGSPTSLPWGVVYPSGSPAAKLWGGGVAVHPTPAYEVAALLVLAGLLSRLRPGSARTGFRWRGFVLGYATLRLLVDAARGDVTRYAGLSLVQWLALASLVALLLVWVRGPAAGGRRGIAGPLGVYP